MNINKVSSKIFLWMTALSGVMLAVMSVMVKTSYSDSLKKNEINVHVRATIRSRYQFDYMMNVLDSAAREIGANEIISNALKEGVSADGFLVNAFLQARKAVQPFIGDIAITGINGAVYSSNLAVDQDALRSRFGKYVDTFRSGSGADYFVDIAGQSFPPVPQNTHNNLLTAVWPVFDTGTQELKGAVFVGLSYSVFQDLFILSPLTNNEKFLMVNNTGKIMYTYPANEYEDLENVLWAFPALLQNTDVTLEGRIGGKDCVIVSEISGVLGWKFIRVIDAKNVTTDTRKMQGYFNIVFASTIIISILFSFYISKLLTRPVEKLYRTCKAIERGDLSERVHITTADEMGQLGRTFNLIMDQINDNFERELVEQKRQNELRIEVLQAQINPHFLYNTLDSIKFLAVLQEAHNIASMCQALITLLKYNLSTRNTALLYEEIESIENYAGIQKYRYGDIFELKTDIAPGSERCVISRFVMQPLVENALIHGFDDMQSGGEIVIRSFFDGDKLCIEARDNGRGMDAAALSRLNRAGLSKSGDREEAEHGSVGIANIGERVRLQFGGRASLTFESAPGAGTTARLIFPAEPAQPEVT